MQLWTLSKLNLFYWALKNSHYLWKLLSIVINIISDKYFKLILINTKLWFNFIKCLLKILHGNLIIFSDSGSFSEIWDILSSEKRKRSSTFHNCFYFSSSVILSHFCKFWQLNFILNKLILNDLLCMNFKDLLSTMLIW